MEKEYFVSFSHCNGFGNNIIKLDTDKIANYDYIREIQNNLALDLQLMNVVILNIILLPI